MSFSHGATDPEGTRSAAGRQQVRAGRKAGVQRRLLPVLALASVATLLSACAPAPDAAPGDAATSDFLPCMVADTGGFNDHSFNQSAHEGIKETASKLGVRFIAVESATETDYDANVSGLIDQGCNLIVTVGYLLAQSTVKAALANPDINFAIIDDRADLDGDGKTDSPNIKPIVFDVAQASFLAGYVAASYTQTGIVGTFAGMNIPPVTIFLDGYVEGIKYYNEKKGTSVKVLGWDVDKQDGLAIGSFVAGTEALTASQGLIDQGADIIQTGGGTTFQSIIAGFQDAGKKPVVIGGDSDMFESDSANAGAYLISVLKGTKVAVVDVIEKSFADGFDNKPYIGTLANGGVGISPFHDFESKVAPTLKAELDAIKLLITDGTIKVASPSSPKQ